MNKANYIGVTALVLCLLFGFAFNSLAPYVPAISGILATFATAIYIVGFLILYYSSTFDGNITIMRRFLGKNIGIGIYNEAGRFARFVHVDFSKDSIEIENQLYPIDRSHIFYRRGSGTPYIVFQQGVANSIDIQAPKSEVDNILVTRFIKQQISLWKTLAFNMIQDRLFLAVVIGIGITIVIGALLYLFGVKPLEQKLDIAIGIVQEYINRNATTAAGGVPSV